MALGVFFEYDLLETFMMLPSNPPKTNGLGSYYFIDDVCVSKYPDCQIVSATEELVEDFDMKISPNPASSSVNVRSNKEIFGIRLYDSSGKLVLLVEPQTTEFTLDVSIIETGFYLIESVFKDKMIKK